MCACPSVCAGLGVWRLRAVVQPVTGAAAEAAGRHEGGRQQPQRHLRRAPEGVPAGQGASPPALGALFLVRV
jgi:hypothetical protein